MMGDAYADEELDDEVRRMERKALLIKVESKLPVAQKPLDGDGSKGGN